MVDTIVAQSCKVVQEVVCSSSDNVHTEVGLKYVQTTSLLPWTDSSFIHLTDLHWKGMFQELGIW